MYYKKRYSQVFLKNKKIILKIINYFKFNKVKYDYLLEIGAGVGYLSKELIKVSNKCLLVEIDKHLIKKLKNNIKNNNIEIININILKLKLYNFKKKCKFYIIGNFPYNISSKIILWLIDNKDSIVECLGTFQKEFINNLIYKKKFKSRLSVYLNLFFNIKKLFNIKKNKFIPKPKVDSTVVRITKKKKIKNININFFLDLIKEAFKYKRKILKNSLKEKIKNINIKKYNKIFYKRAEDLSIKDYIKIYKILYYE